MPVGSSVSEALMAACTSRAAPSMLRERSNCMITVVLPSELLEVISVMPAIVPSDRSSGVAIVDAMVSGLAPGSAACTAMVGKSTCGSGATGSRVNDTAPARARPSVNSVVATGRLMNGAEMFMPGSRLRGAAQIGRKQDK